MTDSSHDERKARKKRDAKWHYSRGDDRVGPLSSGELKRLVEVGDITAETLIWREGMKDWVPAQKVKGLFPEETMALAESDVLSALEHGKAVSEAAASRSREHFASDAVDSGTHGESGSYGVQPLAQATSSSRLGAFGGPRRQIPFEGSFTPDIALLPNEFVLDEFEAGMWDLGLLGWLFGYKRRLVLTTHRLFRFDKKIIDNMLEIVWLRSVKSVVIGQTVNGLQMGIGVLAAIGGTGQILRGLVGKSFEVSALGVGAVGVAVAVIILSRRKIMRVSTGQDKTGMKLVRIESDESKRFADKIFSALADLSTGR